MSDEMQNLADSIAMLEQILEVMPQDGDTLMALYSASRQSGQADRAFDYLNRLMEVASGSGRSDLFAFLEKELPRFAESHTAQAAAQTARLREMIGSRETASKQTGPGREERENERGGSPDNDVTEEMALAWRLYEDNLISQDEYSTILHDLTEVAEQKLNVPASVLHVLHDRGFMSTEGIISYLSEKSEVPFVVLSNFEIGEETAEVIPEHFYTHAGALPFGFIGSDLMVAVLNPFNKRLPERIEAESGHRCHRFLVEAADYDQALERLRSLRKTAA